MALTFDPCKPLKNTARRSWVKTYPLCLTARVPKAPTMLLDGHAGGIPICCRGVVLVTIGFWLPMNRYRMFNVANAFSYSGINLVTWHAHHIDAMVLCGLTRWNLPD